MLLILVSYFVPQEFLAVAFDSGGVTTGPMTVPFIMALGGNLMTDAVMGLSKIRSRFLLRFFYLYRLRKADGESPVCFLKVRLKLLLSLNPQSSTISPTERAVPVR